MKAPNTRLAMTIAKGILASGFIMAASFYGCSRMGNDEPPTVPPSPPTETPVPPIAPPEAPTPPTPPEVITPTAADECAVRVIEEKILPSFENLKGEFDTALELGLNMALEPTLARIEGVARYKINLCAQSTGTTLTDEVVAEQMQRVEAASTEFIEEFKP